MKKLLFSAAFLAMGTTAFAAAIEQVIVRQQWPWSTDVKVEYKLSGVTSPVNIGVTAYNGNVELALPETAIVGDRYGITTDGIGQFTIDPVAAFGTAQVALANFKVKLSVSDSASNVNEVIYKIYNLTDGSCLDVKRADILNGKMGTYESDFGKIGAGFTTSESDLLIWTGVTNDIAYKTTHLVMRKVPAANKVWTMGDTAAIRKAASVQSKGGFETNHLVKISYDYWMGVFELTRKQIETIGGSLSYTPSPSLENLDICPGTKFGYVGMVKKLRDRTGIAGFDVPSEAEWEFACRAGTSTSLPSGQDAASGWWSGCNASVDKLAWMVGNSGDSLHPVGLKAPNAFGLYDVLGNAHEGTRDLRGATAESYYASFGVGWTPDTVVIDPPSPVDGDSLIKGSAFRNYGAYIRSGDRSFSYPNGSTPPDDAGLRVYLKE